MAWLSGDQEGGIIEDEALVEARIPLFRRDGSRSWTVIDLGDLPIAREYRWFEHSKNGVNRYAHANVVLNGRPTIVLLHRILTESPRGRHVDHIDGDGLNNRRSNLRIATASQNLANQVNRRRSSSPYKGTHWIESQQAWRAYIGDGGDGRGSRAKSLGYYDDLTSAALAYDDAARARWGEFALTNFTEEEAAQLPRSPRRPRRVAPAHGSTRYHAGCRCDVCKAAHAAAARAYLARKRAA